MDIIKTKYNNNKYKYGVLDNKIKYLLISNDKFENTEVVINVNIGSNYEKDEYNNGLAHFLEHLLFMGSEKYPEEDYFMKKINEYNGTTNAFTTNENTVYYSIFNSNGYEEILDIYSRFFIDPLFNINSINKEMNAVNEEYNKNLNNEEFKLINYIFNNVFEISDFSIGNIKSLKTKDIRNKIMNFYNNYYTSDNITVCIKSNLELSFIYQKFLISFNNIIKKQKKNKNISINFISRNHYVLRNDEKFLLTLIWKIPKGLNIDIFLEYMNTEKKNGLKYYLKNKRYIFDLEIIYCDKHGYLNIFVEILNYKIIQYNIIYNIIYSYIEKYFTYEYKELYDYINLVNNYKFDNFSHITDCINISFNLFHSDFKNILKYNYIIKDSKKEFEILKKHLLFDNSIIIFNLKDNIFNIKKLNSEKYFNTKYNILKDSKIYRITNEIKWKNLILENKFINFYHIDTKKSDNIYVPIMIYDNIWHCNFTIYNIPNMLIRLFIINPSYINNHIFEVIKILLLELLNKKFYHLHELNLEIHIEDNKNSINNNDIIITYNVVNNKNIIKFLIDKTMLILLNLTYYIEKYYDEKYINYLIEITDIDNYKFLNLIEYNKRLLYHNSKNEYSITYDDIIKTSNKLFCNCELILFLMGNSDITYIKKIFKKLRYKFTKGTLKEKSILENKNYVEKLDIKHPNINEKNNLVVYYYYIKFENIFTIILIDIILDLYSSLFFNEIRTIKQLGYIVNINTLIYNNKYYITQTVQSSKSCSIVIKNIEKFNKNLLNIVDDNIILKHMNNRINIYDNNKYNFENLFSMYSYFISSNNYNFHNLRIDKRELYKSYININIIKKFIKKNIIDNKPIIRIINGN